MTSLPASHTLDSKATPNTSKREVTPGNVTWCNSEDVIRLIAPSNQAGGEAEETAAMQDRQSKQDKQDKQDWTTDSTGDHSQAKTITWHDFGSFFKQVRRQRGYSRETLAERLGCSRIHIWRLETGRNRPSRILLHSLGLAFTLSTEEKATLATFQRMWEYGLEELEPA